MAGRGGWHGRGWRAPGAVLVLAAAFVAGCTNAEPLPEVTGLTWPDSTGSDEVAAVSTVPDPGDRASALATLVEVQPLTDVELTEELAEDAAFAALDADAVARRFGSIESAVDLIYDNGVTVTAGTLGTSSGDRLRVAYRSGQPQPHYLIADLDRTTNRLTTYDENGTVTVDLTTGESTAVESPTAHHSCSFLHCFDTALTIVLDVPGYGWVADKVCTACAGAVESAWILGTPIGEALAGASCIACVAALGAALASSAWVCADDPCDFCMTDDCGEADGGVEYRCDAEGVFGADADTGSTAGRYWAESAYTCEGITTAHVGWWIFGQDVTEYRGTQCVETLLTGPAEACPFGCADPAPGESVSRTCQSPPSECDPNECQGRSTVSGTLECIEFSDGTGQVTQQVEVAGCVDAANGQECGVVATQTEIVATCPQGCSDSGAACAGCPADRMVGDPVCRRVLERVGAPYAVFQQWVHYTWDPALQECVQSTYEREVDYCGTAGCAANGSECSSGRK